MDPELLRSPSVHDGGVSSESADEADLTKPFETFQRHRQSQPSAEPIFCGVVFKGHKSGDTTPLPTSRTMTGVWMKPSSPL